VVSLLVNIDILHLPGILKLKKNNNIIIIEKNKYSLFEYWSLKIKFEILKAQATLAELKYLEQP